MSTQDSILRPPVTRRSVIRSLSAGSLLLPGILGDLLGAESPAAGPLAPRQPHFAPKAKQVIFIYLSGGVSHVDTFDPKPALKNSAGKEFSPNQYLFPSPWEFTPHGKCGTEVSALFPEIGQVVDELCVIRSMRTDHNNHAEAALGLHTGSFAFTRPGMGAWVSYGLGTFNQNLPSYIILAPEDPYTGTQLWSADFLPAVHQGVRVRGGKNPIRDCVSPVPEALQQEELDLLARMNRRFGQGPRSSDSVLSARVQSFETAFRMQTEAPEVFDPARESDATLGLYGLKRGDRSGFAWQCLIARRLIQKGVRFVEIIDSGSSSSSNWDAAHGGIRTHESRARRVDRPVAALIKDLRALGLLKDTLVVFCSEFGRTPFTNNPDSKGREHHNLAFSAWIAGAGIKRGITYGESDEIGNKVARNEVHVHDLHATMLHLLGMNHEKLTYRHAARDFRLTDVSGEVVRGILA